MKIRYALPLFLFAASTWAQPGPVPGPMGPPQPPQPPGLGRPGEPRPPEDPIASKLYPPELIMAHQAELSIDDKQRDAIIAEIQQAQPKILKLQWTLQEASGQLARMLGEAKVDEAKTLAQADKLMDMEREMKRTHLTLLVRIRNLLTDAQRAKLDAFRGAGR
jgi:hypothetical protein